MKRGKEILEYRTFLWKLLWIQWGRRLNPPLIFRGRLTRNTFHSYTSSKLSGIDRPLLRCHHYHHHHHLTPSSSLSRFDVTFIFLAFIRFYPAFGNSTENDRVEDARGRKERNFWATCYRNSSIRRRILNQTNSPSTSTRKIFTKTKREENSGLVEKLKS